MGGISLTKNETESRVMKVTMRKTEWEDYDNGKVCSNKGMRNKNTGRMTAQPDISPIDKADFKQRKIIRKEVVPQKFILETLVGAVAGTVIGRLFPFAMEKATSFLEKKVVPVLDSIWSDSAKRDMRRQVPSQSTIKTSLALEMEDTSQDERFVASQAQVDAVVAATRKKVQELSELIYLLSRIYIKDEKTGEERQLERDYINRLFSDEAASIMRYGLENRHKLSIDDETAESFNDFLNGYIRNGTQLIALKADEKDE